MDLNQLKEVFSDSQFVKELFELEQPHDVQKALSNKGIELSISDIETIKDILTRYENGQLTVQEKKLIENASKQDEQLDDDALETVTGGSLMVFGIVVACLSVVAFFGGTGAGIHYQTRGRW